MNFQSSILIGVALFAVGFLAGLKSCNHETVETIHEIDTFKLPAVVIHDKANIYVTKTIAGQETHDTLLLRQIDTVFKREGIQEFTACLDTVVQDTFHVCYRYVAHAFDMRVGFVPRIHDTTFQVFPKRNAPFFNWHPIVGVEWNNGYALAGGVAASAWILEGSAILSIGATVQPRLSVMARF